MNQKIQNLFLCRYVLQVFVAMAIISFHLVMFNGKCALCLLHSYYLPHFVVIVIVIIVLLAGLLAQLFSTKRATKP